MNNQIIGSVVKENKGVAKETGRPYHFVTILDDERGIVEANCDENVSPFGVNSKVKYEFEYVLGTWSDKYVPLITGGEVTEDSE